MTLPLRPLGDRVLIRPDIERHAVETHPSGVLTAQSMAAAITGEDARLSVSRGTVLAVGTPVHPLKYEVEALAEKLSVRYGPDRHPDMDNDIHHPDVEDAIHMLSDIVHRTPSVAVGDDVLFSPAAGQQLTMDGETFIICHEHELLAIVEA